MCDTGCIVGWDTMLSTFFDLTRCRGNDHDTSLAQMFKPDILELISSLCPFSSSVDIVAFT